LNGTSLNWTLPDKENITFCKTAKLCTHREHHAQIFVFELEREWCIANGYEPGSVQCEEGEANLREWLLKDSPYRGLD
jgi:hypothetical protein